MFQERVTLHPKGVVTARKSEPVRRSLDPVNRQTRQFMSPRGLCTATGPGFGILSRHATVLQSSPSLAVNQQFVKTLSRQYGNAYVQRVLAKCGVDAGTIRTSSAVVARQVAAAAPGATHEVRSLGGLRVRRAIQEAAPEELAAIVTELRRAAALAPADRSIQIGVLVAGTTQIASYEAQALLAEAEHASALVPNLETLRGPTLVQGNVAGVRTQLTRARAVLTDAGLSNVQRAEISAGIVRAEVSLRTYERLSTLGEARQAGMVPLAGVGGAVVADDVTVVGVADDWLLPFVGLAMLAVLIATNPSPPQRELDEAWRRLGDDLRELAHVGSGILMAVQGPRAAGQLTNIARHLARLLALGGIGGVPSGEPPKKDDRDDKHWWSEIKGSIRQFLQATKGASRRQVMRELLRFGFTEAQIAEIEVALAHAAQQMGEAIENLLPPP